MNTIDFNFHLRKMKRNKKSLSLMYEYCCGILTKHIVYAFGKKDYVEDAVHEIFEYLFKNYNPKKYIRYPAAWLCRTADNHVKSLLAKKENNVLELIESYGYNPCFEENVEIIGKNFKRAWDKLDAVSRDILIMHSVMGYALDEIAEIMNLSYVNVRAKSSRAKKYLRRYGKDEED